MNEKEEYAIVLDFLPYGYPLEKNMQPVVQAVGKNSLILLHLVPRKGVSFEAKEEVYIGEGKRDKILFIKGRLHREKLSENAKEVLKEVIEKYVKENEKKIIEFINKAEAINKRLHQLELLPGLGNKHCQTILEEREKKPFESFEEIKKRLPGIPDIEKCVEKRIFEELTEMQRYNIFVK
ncbi:MAG: DUF655 domain-containing protein [Candidatus Pacearchaeota archaeon]